MLTNLIVSCVDLSRRCALAIILLALAITAGLGFYDWTHFKINADVNQLISGDLPWKKQEAEMEKLFPQKVDTLLIVVDGDTADAAEAAASELAGSMNAEPGLFKTVTRPDAIPYFRKNGLMLLPKSDMSIVLDQLVQAQPMLGTLTNDPSLHGFFNTVTLMAMGVKMGQADYAMVDQPFAKIADTVDAALAGQDKPLALRSMMAGDKPSLRETRRFILTQPLLNYSELEPGKVARDEVKKLIQTLQLTADHGVHVRMTGSVALNDEEFASVANGTGFATMLSGFLVFVILLIALRSLRIIIPILLTLIVGLVSTTAFALLAVGSLNLISIAFAVMFIGIAVDFGIQFGVRYRDQHFREPNHAKAMTRTAKIIGVPLAMAAASTSLGFLAFIPTAYRGVSELGLIAGVGMLIAFALNVTLLPALMAYTRPPAEKEAVGYRWAAPIDRFLIRHRYKVLSAALIAAFAGIAIMTHLRFDFDPLDLKDPKTESVSTLFDLMKDPDFSAYTIDLLRPSLQDAQQVADQLSKLPEVDHVTTLASFVPDDQEAKLAMIADTGLLLGPTLALPHAPTPTEAETYDSVTKLATALHSIEADHPSAARLAASMDIVAKRHDPALMERLSKNIIGVMLVELETVKQILLLKPVTLADITPDLRDDWVTGDGRYLIQVYPKGDARNHKTFIAFTSAVRQVAPDAGGSPISIQESGRTVTGAFIHAGMYAVAAIALLSLLVLRRIKDVIRLLTPLILAGILTLATIVLIKLPLNFANIIALPLLLSLGVSYAIYFVSYWRAGSKNPLQSSMARAVLFSAATVLVAFGSLALSSHPGTASMGELLTVALLYSLTSTFFILPALLGPPKEDKS